MFMDGCRALVGCAGAGRGPSAPPGEIGVCAHPAEPSKMSTLKAVPTSKRFIVRPAKWFGRNASRPPEERSALPKKPALGVVRNPGAGLPLSYR